MKLVELNTIFEIEYGNQFDLIKMKSDQNGVNFISRSSQNLGVVDKVEEIFDVEPYEAGLITVTLGGTYLLSSFVQQHKFYTAQNVKVLTPRREMDMVEKIFYCLAISKNRFRYSSHGREANVSLDCLLVPEKMPDSWNKISVEDYSVADDSVLSKKMNLDTRDWVYFKLNDLFEITGSKTTPLLELEDYGEGNYPYVTTQATNNGVQGKYSYFTEEGNIIACDSAVVGFCAYQPMSFSASDHVEKLIPKFEMNKYSAIFLVTILNLEQFRYSYGRKRSQERMKKEMIKLPSKAGKPDWDYIESYIKVLPYSTSLD